MSSNHRNQPVIDSLKRELFREQARRNSAIERIGEIRRELKDDFGVDLTEVDAVDQVDKADGSGASVELADADRVGRIIRQCALLQDTIGLIEYLDAGFRPALGASWQCGFHELPPAYIKTFAAVLADEAKFLRVQGAATAEGLRKELALWVGEFSHAIQCRMDGGIGQADGSDGSDGSGASVEPVGKGVPVVRQGRRFVAVDPLVKNSRCVGCDGLESAELCAELPCMRTPDVIFKEVRP